MAAYNCHQNERGNHHTFTVLKYFQNKICIFCLYSFVILGLRTTLGYDQCNFNRCITWGKKFKISLT